MDLLKVSNVEYISGYKLSVSFTDGSKLICDLSQVLQSGVFQALQDITRFKSFSVNDGVVEWPGELDIAPEYLFKIGTPAAGGQKPLEPDYVSWTA